VPLEDSAPPSEVEVSTGRAESATRSMSDLEVERAAAIARIESAMGLAGRPSDPIAATPQARWFVRPPSGGQFGPAPGNVLRDWIAEGRVTPDTFVWCEGWPEWQRAQAVFGDFSAVASLTAAALPEVSTESRAKSTSELYRRRKSTKMTLVVVGLLLLACALLFAALVYVVRFMD
jgi:hypothetical protein